jgi:hypothetical protein
MKRAALIWVALTLAACDGGQQQASAPAPPASAAPKPVIGGWTATDGIKTPESVYYDARSGFIFSSQIDGAADAKDGNGHIAKLNGDGAVVNSHFVTGLNAPKGLRACNGTLWIADLGEIVAADVATGAVKSRVAIPDAMLLNDVACDGDKAFVSDMMGNKIYEVSGGAAKVAAEGDLEFPNGLLVDGTKFVIGGWGSQPKPDFTTDRLGHIFSYDPATKTKTLITNAPIGNIDGLESDGRGGYLATDYLKGTLYHVMPNGEFKEVRQFKAGAADIGYVPGSKIVLVPHMNENQISAYDLTAELQ